MLRHTAIVFAVFFVASAWAEVVRVPEDVMTVQSALDIIDEGDTILVGLGIYEEELTAPEFGFFLMGDVEPDTGLYLRPVIDPASLSSPATRACIRNLQGNVVIERMWFRNGAAMHPHEGNGAGGLINESANLVLRDCVFDSVSRGVLSFDYPVTLERCVFRASVRNCVYAARTSLQATDCDFESLSTEWSGIFGGDGTTIERCRISGTAGLWEWMLTVGGGSWHVRNNVIGPCGGSRHSIVLLVGPNGVFEDNMIAGCRNVGSVLEVRPQCEGMLEIRNNTIIDNAIEEHKSLVAPLFGVQAQYDSFTLCSRVLISGNLVSDNLSFGLAKGLRTGGDNIVSRNTFRNLLPDSLWAVEIQDGNQTFWQNIFEGNGRALMSELGFSVHAENNYWGHASGPFHPWLNPLGQGDEVGDNVEFDPWYTDTLFNVESLEPRVPLPERASLVAYPNPFNAVTTLKLTLPRAGIARVELFDITGRKLHELWSGAVGESREIQFDGTNFASGMYFVRAWDPLGNRLWGATKIVILK